MKKLQTSSNFKKFIKLRPNSKYGHFTPEGYDFIVKTIIKKIK